MSTSRRLLVVMGATGAQGSSVIRYAAEQGGWDIRAITRDPSADKAQKLKHNYSAIELAKGDADDQDTLLAAFQGATALFAMTDFYTPTNLERLKEGRLGEVEQAKRIADAAKAAAVKYVVWSGLHNSEELTGNSGEELEGTRPPQAIMFTAKNMGEQYARNIGLQVIGMWPGWFLQNIPTGLMPGMAMLSEGTLEWSLPLRSDLALPTIDIDQVGHFVLRMLSDPERWVGKRVLAASEYTTMDSMARTYTRVSGQLTRYRQLTYKEYRQQQADTPWVEAYVEMFRYFNLRGYFSGESLNETEEEFGRTNTFSDWLANTGWRADVDKLKREGQTAHAAATAATSASRSSSSSSSSSSAKDEQDKVKRIVRSSADELIKNSPELKDLPIAIFHAPN